MIQDRLTAKFLNAKPAKRAPLKSRQSVEPKVATTTVADNYTRGRTLIGTFWL